MMLGKYYKFHVVNNSGQTLTEAETATAELFLTKWYINSGKLAYSVSTVNLLPSGTWTDGTAKATSEIDNSSDLYIGVSAQLKVQHDEGSAAEGTFDIYYESSGYTGEQTSEQTSFPGVEASGMQMIGQLLWDSTFLDDEVAASPEYGVE